MITPLAQRQMFQTINAEAVKAALEVSGQFQRELAQKQAMIERLVEDQTSVPQIPRAEGLKIEERKGGKQGQEQEGQAKDQDEPDGTAQAGPEANPAETHMDFLA
jgi:hypothetical protein